MEILVAIACLIGSPILGFYWGAKLTMIGLVISATVLAVTVVFFGKKSNMDSQEGTLSMIVCWCSFLCFFGVLFGASEILRINFGPYLDIVKNTLFK